MKLFLNPPGKEKYLRDYYCPGVTKGVISYPPIDFIYMSAVEEEIDFIDLINDNNAKIDFPKYTEIIILVSIISFKEDIQYIKEIKKLAPDSKIGITGDVAKQFSEGLLKKYTFINFVIEDFFSYFKRGNQEYKILPQYEKFNFERYFFPFYRNVPVAHILTEYGCEFKCGFCPLCSISPDYIPEYYVELQLRKLKSMGYDEVHVRDQTFGVESERFYKMCDLFNKYKFSWSCFARLDMMTKEKIDHLKNSNCHTVMFGIETADDKSRKRHQKGFKGSEIFDILDYCKKINLKTLGTFIIGLPNESVDDFKKTINFSTSLPLDYASFNLASFRLNTTMSDKLTTVQLDNLEERAFYCDDNKTARQFVAKANIRFYLRVNKLVSLAKIMLLVPKAFIQNLKMFVLLKQYVFK